MNSIVVFCHFCELHGPSILFCTQAFHSSQDPDATVAGLGPSEVASYFDGANHSTYSPTASESGSLATYALPHSTVTPFHSKSSTCESCRSLAPGVPGFLSNDHAAHISYISGQYPYNPDLYSAVRQACVRSLSCEVCPGREGPMLFGDDKNGFVFSYAFFIRDTQARGSQRWYSICLLMSDRVHLVNSWPFLAGSIRLVVDDLQAKANVTFQSDNAARNTNGRHGASGMAGGSNSGSNSGINSGGQFNLPPDQMWRRRGNRTLRSLADLTSDARLFANLHASFAWVLRTCASRLFEKQIEGPSMICAQSEQWDPSHSGNLLAGDPDSSFSEGEVLASGEVFTSLRHLHRTIGAEFFRLVVYNLSVGNQVIVRGVARDTVSSVLLLLKDLLPPTCCSIVLYSRMYRDRWECNLLGLCPRATVPAYVDTSSYVLLDIERAAAGQRRRRQSAASSALGETDTSLAGTGNHDRAPTALNEMAGPVFAALGNGDRGPPKSGIGRAVAGVSAADSRPKSGSATAETLPNGVTTADSTAKGDGHKDGFIRPDLPIFHALLNDMDDISLAKSPTGVVVGEDADVRPRGSSNPHNASSSRRSMPWSRGVGDAFGGCEENGDVDDCAVSDFSDCRFVLHAGNHREATSGNSFTRAMERVLGPDCSALRGEASWWNADTIGLLSMRMGTMSVSASASASASGLGGRDRTASAASSTRSWSVNAGDARGRMRRSTTLSASSGCWP
eukprot:Opistho-2@79592